jgi:hypothetical protein
MAKHGWKEGKSKRNDKRSLPDSKQRSNWEGEAAAGGSWSRKSRRSLKQSLLSFRRITLLVLFLAFCAAIAYFISLLRLERPTPIVFLTSSDGMPKSEVLFHSDPFAELTLGWFEDQVKQNKDLTILKHDGVSNGLPISQVIQEQGLPKLLLQKLLPGGPEKQVVLIYVYASGIVEDDVPFVLTSQSSIGDKSTWIPLREFLLQTIGSDPGKKQESLQRIILLDCGRLVSPTNAGLVFNDFPQHAIKTLEALRSEGKPGAKNTWMIVSQDDGQQGWTSPELGGSVFGFFVAQGLNGWADQEPNKQVSFQELADYLARTVAGWAADHRDSIQTPIVSIPEGRNPAELALIFANPVVTPRPQPSTEKQDTLEFWKKLYESQRWETALHLRPLWLAESEARLMRLEQLRLEPGTNQEFDELQRQLIEELDRPFSAESDRKRPSLIARESTGDLMKLTDDELKWFGEQLLKKFAQKPAAPAAAQTGANVDKAVHQAEPPQTPPGDAAPDEKAKDPLASLTQIRLAQYVWHFLGQDPQHIQQFQNCVDLLDERAEEFVEIQFLKLIAANVSVTGSSEETDRQAAIYQAIRIRDLSEAIVQDSSLIDIAGGWRFISDDYTTLEESRRAAEDLLFADHFLQAANKLESLQIEYPKLRQRAEMVRAARRAAEESLWIAPHLQSFLVREALTSRSASSVGAGFNGVKELLRSGVEISEELQGASQGLDYVKLQQQTAKNVELRDRWRKAIVEYAQLDIDKLEHSDARNLRIRLNLLQSPLPEWVRMSDGAIPDRKKLTADLASRLQQQSRRFFDEKRWDPNKSAQLSSDEKKINRRDLLILDDVLADRIGFSPEVKESQLQIAMLDRWSLTGTQLHEFGMLANKLQKDPRADSIDGQLIARQRQLGEIDYLIRLLAPSLAVSRGEPVEDVGERLKNIENYLLISALRDRAIADLWGSGPVSNAEDSLFVRNAKLYDEIRPGLHKDERELISGISSPALVKTATEKIASLRFAWKIEGGVSRKTGFNDLYEIAYNEGETAIAFSTDLTGDRELESMPLLSGVTGSLFVQRGDRLFPAQFTLVPATNEDSQTDNQADKQLLEVDHALSTMITTHMLLDQTLTLNQQLVYAFRGHLLESDFRLREIRRPDSVVAHYLTELTKAAPMDANVTVFGNEKEISDVIFVLDCSKSMNNLGASDLMEEAAKGRVKTRLENAKQAMIELLESFKGVGRLRVGFLAFGHRSKFLEGEADQDGKVPFSGPIHPFYDCETIVSLADKMHGIDDVTSNDAFAEIQRKIGEQIQEGRGVTPLYFSILQAAKELERNRLDRPKQIVVLTDGVNFQGIEGGDRAPKDAKEINIAEFRAEWEKKYSQIKLHIVLMQPTDKPYEVYLEEEVKKLESGNKEENDVKLTFIREIELKRYPLLVSWVKETSNLGKVNLIEARDGSVDDVKEKLMRAIRFAKFAVEPDEGREKTELGSNQRIRVREKRSYTVRMYETDTPAAFPIFLEGGENIQLDYNKTTRLMLRPFAQDFVDETPVALGESKYLVGRMHERLWFGFKNEDSTRKFSYRPARIWAEVTPQITGEQLPFYLQIIDYQYENGREIPIMQLADIEFPENIPWKTKSKLVDVRLWVKPHPEETREVLDPLQPSRLEIDRTYENIKRLKCTTQRPERDQFNVVIEAADAKEMRRNFAVICPDAVSVTRKSTLNDGKLVREVHQFVLRSDLDTAPFAELYIGADKPAPIQKSDEKIRTGEATDPIFGDRATWIEFHDVPLVN